MYYLQAKQGAKVLQEHNIVCPEIMLDINLTLIKENAPEADLIEIFTFDSLVDTRSIKFCRTINLKEE